MASHFSHPDPYSFLCGIFSKYIFFSFFFQIFFLIIFLPLVEFCVSVCILFLCSISFSISFISVVSMFCTCVLVLHGNCAKAKMWLIHDYRKWFSSKNVGGDKLFELVPYHMRALSVHISTCATILHLLFFLLFRSRPICSSFFSQFEVNHFFPTKRQKFTSFSIKKCDDALCL